MSLHFYVSRKSGLLELMMVRLFVILLTKKFRTICNCTEHYQALSVCYHPLTASLTLLLLLKKNVSVSCVSAIIHLIAQNHDSS